MELRTEVINFEGKKIPHQEISIELKQDGSTDHLVKCMCLLCKSAYTQRPLICRCASNVFLREVENGQLKK